MDKLMTAVLVSLLAATLGAQTPPAQKPVTPTPVTQAAPQTPPKPVVPTPAQAPPQTAKPAVPAASQGVARATATLFVTNPAGKPIPDVNVTLTGAADRAVITTHEGAARIANLRSGTYRARFESPDYILFEKELVLRPGQPWEFEVTLNPAPAKKIEAAPTPPPVNPPKTAQVAPEPGGEPTMLSLTDWLDSNLIGRNEPQKDSPIVATAGAAASVFQVREDVANRSHAEADEMLYVIAGEATLRIGDRARAIAPGWFVTIPRGTTFGLERRGRNPLILLSIVAPGKGAPPGPR